MMLSHGISARCSRLVPQVSRCAGRHASAQQRLRAYDQERSLTVQPVRSDEYVARRTWPTPALPTLTPMTRQELRSANRALIPAAIGFLVFYLSTDFVAPNLASSSLPLPNAPTAQARAWFADNPLATVTMSLCQLLSVACLAAFVLLLRRTAPEHARRATPWG